MDYRYVSEWKAGRMREQRRNARRAALFGVVALLVYGFVGYMEQEPVVVAQTEIVAPVAKSRTQEEIETLLPEPVAKSIAERSKYPRTMASIAHTESRGNHKAVGDGGKAKGLFQVWGSLHGPVPDTIEGQVDQANRMFIELVNKHGYRRAVALWNGTPSNPVVKEYQQVVLAKVGEMGK